MSSLQILTIVLALHTLVPAQTRGTVSSPEAATGGERRVALAGGAELFVPAGLRLDDGSVDLLVHFHGDPATVEREFLASGIAGVLITVNCKGLSAAYAAAFDDPDQFGRILDGALDHLRRNEGIPPSLRWGSVRVSSFSAGFGAVREILKVQQNVDRIDALCMADSIYAGYVDADDDRRVNPEHMISWRRFAEAAARGRKTFVLTHTDLVPGTYASTRETADDLIAHVDATRREVSGQDVGPFDLTSRAGVKGFQVYGCGGDDGEAHMQHLRSLAHWIRLLDATPVGSDPDEIRAAINAFAPIWLPSERELQGWTIMLHPAGADGVPGGRSADGLSFWTAAYLYHLIRHSGGTPILTRADLQAGRSGLPGTDDATLVRRCRESRADLLLIFDASPVGETAPPSDELTRSLAAGFDRLSGVGETGAVALPDSPCPAVRLTLSTPPSKNASTDLTPVHRVHAEELYKALAHWINHHRAELRRRRAERKGDHASSGENALFPESRKRHQDKVALLARSIWTDGALPMDKAEWFASVFQRLSLSDRTIVYFQPQVRVIDDTVVIGGATTVPVLTETLQAAFHRVGVDKVRSEMRLLPDAGRLGDDLFGACRVPTALTRREPRPQSLPQSQLLYGEPVFLLDRQDGQLLIQAGDGYWGWVAEEAIAPMDRDRFSRSIQARHAVLLNDVEHGQMILPRGARLPIASQAAGTSTLITPDHGHIALSSGAVRILERDQSPETRTLRAIEWLHTPYVFGGRSPLGPDCSGFVTNLFDQEGMPIARDAAGQFLSGKLVATPWYREGIRPGDRLYFINGSGKVFHTGIALSATHFIHSSSPAVQISSLKSGDRLYVAAWDRAFLAAKRP